MKRGPENAISVEFMGELVRAHAEVDENPEIRALILCSDVPGYFSNGLDAEELLRGDQERRVEIFIAFYECVKAMLKFSKLHVSLIEGHAMAGGAVLASTSDFRLCVEGSARFSFSEVRIGLAIPPPFLSLFESIMPRHAMNRALLLCEAFKPKEGLELGIYQKLLPLIPAGDPGASGDSLRRAKKFVGNMLQYPDSSLLLTRRELRRPIIESFELQQSDLHAAFNDYIREELTEGLSAVIERRRPRFH